MDMGTCIRTTTIGHLPLGIPSAGMPPQPALPLADLSAGTTVADAEMPNAGEPDAAPNAELNQIYLAAPLTVAALDGMLDPPDADVVTLPNLSTMVCSQPAEIIASRCELIPKVVRQLNLVFQPQRRLESLLCWFDWSFVAGAPEPVGLSNCIARNAAGVSHTPF